MFHLALPIVNLEDTMDFYLNVLNAKLGRLAASWADFNLFNNQITVQENINFTKLSPVISTEGIPINHFGIILKLNDWDGIKDKFISGGVPFLIEPKVVFEGQVGEQFSFFVEDPNGYAIDFKGFKSLDSVFLKH